MGGRLLDELVHLLGDRQLVAAELAAGELVLDAADHADGALVEHLEASDVVAVELAVRLARVGGALPEAAR